MVELVKMASNVIPEDEPQQENEPTEKHVCKSTTPKRSESEGHNSSTDTTSDHGDQSFKLTTPNRSESEGHNNAIDTTTAHGGELQLPRQNMISINGLPSNMTDERLFKRLEKVFSNVGKFKINQQTRRASIDLFRDMDSTFQSKVTATITFEHEESVMEAIQKYNGKPVPILDSPKIYVKKSEM
ncbi:unnamed protein product [Adineta steineri]|uniref:RRM domain-containing protein n=1 Tax=Adineta steineri TaxID=433720 RepID=A0A815WUZ0_9BILA|nr:unnamed protein product [Adineta steineri]CAF1549207.1 unnamed protein product [Adineta steineri]